MSKSLNKQDLISQIAEQSDCTQAQATKMLNSTIDVITSTLSSGGSVNLTGFGKFETAARKATTGRNPQTGQTIQIAASTQPKFRAGKALKDAVN